MSTVTGDVLIGEAKLGQRDRRFASGSVTIGITPNSVVLQSEAVSRGTHIEGNDGLSYQFAITDDRHDAQRLHTVLIGLE